MTSVIVDRRPDKGKSTANRQRVLKRLSGALKAQVEQLIARRKLNDHDKSAEVTIERKDVKEPSFSLDPASGDSARVVPGNQHYRVGDKIPRDPAGGQGQRTRVPAKATPTMKTCFVSRCRAKNICRCSSMSSNCRRW